MGMPDTKVVSKEVSNKLEQSLEEHTCNQDNKRRALPKMSEIEPLLGTQVQQIGQGDPNSKIQIHLLDKSRLTHIDYTEEVQEPSSNSEVFSFCGHSKSYIQITVPPRLPGKFVVTHSLQPKQSDSEV